MFGGRQGRAYVTRTHPDNRGTELGTVVRTERGEVIVELSAPIEVGDGVAFEPPVGMPAKTVGFHVAAVRTLDAPPGVLLQAIRSREPIGAGWTVLRSAQASLLEAARASVATVGREPAERKERLDVRLFGAAGAPLKGVFSSGGESVTVRSDHSLSQAANRPLDERVLREQIGRLGETPFVLGTLDAAALAPGLFLPVSELNHLRQQGVDELSARRDWARGADSGARTERIATAIAHLPVAPRQPRQPAPFLLGASVWRVDDARAAAAAGATEVVLDPFLRHPAPTRSRVRALSDELSRQGVVLRLRTPTIVRPEERFALDPWLALDLPILTGHLGLVASLAGEGRDVVADYAVNCFNQHTSAQLFRLGAHRIVHSIELTTDEALAAGAPWDNTPFDSVVYGRPEGMTIEHCVLSAAFDRVPTTCRDLCVQKHPNVTVTDPAGYAFPVATDSACRNRLLHSRPIEGSEYIPRLWAGGVRGYRMLFTVPGDEISGVVASYRAILDALARDAAPDNRPIRALVGSAFTRGHFARAV
ncbi:MAG: hypothetical protein NVS9B3_15730 [Gemmatimonadaceae bacterium]